MKVVDHFKNLVIGLFCLASSAVWADDPTTFEKAGVIESINRANKTLVMDGVELKVPETLKVNLDGRLQGFYQVMIPGAVVTLSGEGNGNGPSSVITNMFVHDLHPVEE